MIQRIVSPNPSRLSATCSHRQAVCPLLAAILMVLVTACGGTESESGGGIDTATSDTATQSASAGPWDEARRRGVEFRAIGQEPGWSLGIDEDGMIEYAGDYGQTRVSVPTPEAVRDTVARSTTYTVRTASHNVAIAIREEPCSDVMSGEAFTHAVTVRVDGKEVRGCGRRL